MGCKSRNIATELLIKISICVLIESRIQVKYRTVWIKVFHGIKQCNKHDKLKRQTLPNNITFSSLDASVISSSTSTCYLC